MASWNTDILIGLVVLFLSFAAAGLVILYFEKRLRSNLTDSSNEIRFSATKALSHAIKGLNFRDALHFERASGQVTETILGELNNALSGAADSIVVSLQAVDIAQSKDLILAAFPKAAKHLMKNGRAAQVATKNGEKLLVAVDSKGHRFISQARHVDPSVVSKLSEVATLVVGAAHIIAGYDNAKKLKKIDKKLDVLITRDSNDLVSQLEAIFESLKEQSADVITELNRLHLIGLKFQLKQLRCRWFNDVSSALRMMENPDERSFFSKLFSRRSTVARGVQNELSFHEEPLYLIRFSVNLEQMIAQALAEETVFTDITIPDIQRQVEELRRLVDERRTWIASLSGSSKQTASDFALACQVFEESLVSDTPAESQLTEKSIETISTKKKVA